jgi:hypothetical protein
MREGALPGVAPVSQDLVLDVLYRLGGPRTVAEIAGWLEIHRPRAARTSCVVSDSLRRLENRGEVRRAGIVRVETGRGAWKAARLWEAVD